MKVAQNGVRRWSHVNTVMNLRVPLKMKSLLPRCGILSCHEGIFSSMELDAIGTDRRTSMRATLLCLSSHMAKPGFISHAAHKAVNLSVLAYDTNSKLFDL